MNRITLAMTSEAASGKTTLMEFLIHQLTLIGAVQPFQNKEVWREAEVTVDHHHGVSTEAYDLQIDREKVRAYLNASRKGMEARGALDNQFFTQPVVTRLVTAMLEEMDFEDFECSDYVNVRIERLGV